MSILKRQVSSSWLFASLFIVMTHNSTVNLKLIQSSYISTLDKKILSKFQNWHLQVLWWKFAKFLMSFSKRNKPVIIQILHHSAVSWKIIPLYFFRSNNIYFAQKELMKMKIFETFEWSGQILSNTLCQFWNDKSILLQILYHSSVSWKIIPLYLFSSSNIYFAQNEPIKMTIFETLKCSGQISSNSLCQFWNDKSIPLQVFYPSSVLWKIIPLYFLAQTIYTLLKRSSLKWKFLRLSSGRVKFCQIPYANFETTNWFLPKFCIPFQFHER